jgi:hypothetical protein
MIHYKFVEMNAPWSLLTPVFSVEQYSTCRFIDDWVAAAAEEASRRMLHSEFLMESMFRLGR